ncbi:hypothetical protein MtrunA17_Chr4g0026971 [Medicago truncatula]|uniref:Uncharacterized protein n=1 Tax=Medicago truncatula TaxID=3880 RepID=A0A396IA68_MEDTR|nr:hypothetical protein MtrunA17_Chr4g0026971 [Medicago truncatula]
MNSYPERLVNFPHRHRQFQMVKSFDKGGTVVPTKVSRGLNQVISLKTRDEVSF